MFESASSGGGLLVPSPPFLLPALANVLEGHGPANGGLPGKERHPAGRSERQAS